MPTLDPVTQRRPALAPPTRWRNKWRAQSTLLVHCCDRHPAFGAFPGQEWFACYLHPSRDVAETVARECEAYDLLTAGKHLAKWQGAFPESL